MEVVVEIYFLEFLRITFAGFFVRRTYKSSVLKRNKINNEQLV
jgi:hypothetical protein